MRLIAVVELLPGVLDAQLRRDAGLSHFEYFVLAMLSEAPRETLRMTALAAQTNASLSHVVARLEQRDLLTRFPCPEDARATNVRLTRAGRDIVRAAAPGHVATVREHALDALTARQVRQLRGIAEAILSRLDPEGAMAATYRRYDAEPPRPG